ncbi:MAG: hypothetical protein OQL28_06005 [Sedimenticola sp.]|nr:hypothetical protein [Sedimenticola sp.]
MRIILSSIFLLIAFVSPVQAQGYSDEQLESIRQLGRLNGVALNCRYVDETRRMKKALVLALPKRRQLGELFDTETNDAFLKFIEQRRECPLEAELNQQVDQAIMDLDKAFARD